MNRDSESREQAFLDAYVAAYLAGVAADRRVADFREGITSPGPDEFLPEGIAAAADSALAAWAVYLRHETAAAAAEVERKP